MRKRQRSVRLLRRGLVVLSVTSFAIMALASSPLQSGPSAVEAAVPPSLAQGFADIVKRVTPAVVNIAVTGGEGGRREGGPRRPLPPGPFGGPPGEEPPGAEPPVPPPLPGPPGGPG
ncbi:MAG: Do family serine endopeptidase, partial [Nitrospiraceae bacterium]